MMQGACTKGNGNAKLSCNGSGDGALGPSPVRRRGVLINWASLGYLGWGLGAAPAG